MSLTQNTVYGKSGKVPTRKTRRIFVETPVKPYNNIMEGQLWRSLRRANTNALVTSVVKLPNNNLMISYSYMEFEMIKYHTVAEEKNFRSEFVLKRQ
jgi:hypothetical protein